VIIVVIEVSISMTSVKLAAIDVTTAVVGEATKDEDVIKDEVTGEVGAAKFVVGFGLFLRNC
jgi:hypothetical protein